MSRSLGAQCESRDDCDERCLRGDDYPDGMCTTSCESDRDCPLAARCIDEEGGVCMYSCGDAADCEFLGSGWDCKDKDAREDGALEVEVCFGS
ncbi:MAG: hypothetical protein GY811_11430 [Myxococcales bacterium]|nr:hypothetical protein [Myxococcales bacterium]